jgi:integrase
VWPASEIQVGFLPSSNRFGFPSGSRPKAWYQYRGLVPHDFRRSAVRNLVNSGVDTATAMKITGHRTLHIFMRYNIISTGQLHEAMDKVTSKRKAAK